MRSISTDGLILEPQTPAHAEEMFAVLSDPAIYEHENEPPSSIEWLRSRFKKLESRVSPDGHEHWLNWVIRVPGSGLIGYVQATVHPDGTATIAYELSSSYWGQGLASKAVQAMIRELVASYQVRTLFAILKATNSRSHRFLGRLGFLPASSESHSRYSVDADEILMFREDIQ